MASTNIRLLDNVGVTGDGPSFRLPLPEKAAAIQAEITGSPTQCVINLMGLLDGGTFDVISVLDITNGYVSGKILNFPQAMLFRLVKANVSALTAGCFVSLFLTTTA